jgi:hypothetical protein
MDVCLTFMFFMCILFQNSAEVFFPRMYSLLYDHSEKVHTVYAGTHPACLMCLLLYAQVEDDGNDILCLPIDFQQLQELRMFIEDKLNESPKEALLCMGVAAHLVDVYSSYNLVV